MRHPRRAPFVAALLCLVAAPGATEAARYRYGNYASGSGEHWFFVLLEGGLMNPRNTDAVVATQETIEDFGGGTNSLLPVIPEWDDEATGRIAVGYAWGEGNRVSVGGWTYSGSQAAAGDGSPSGRLHFAVGPPILTGGTYVGDNATPGSFDLETEIEALVVDAEWARVNELGESLVMEWSLGLRYATYEETTRGIYDEAASSSGSFGLVQYEADKSHEATGIGARAAVRGRLRLGRGFDALGGVGISFLDGDIDAASRLTPVGLDNRPTTPGAQALVFDDSRSGTIRDLEALLLWHTSGEAIEVHVGWRQSVWDELVRDLLRNHPGTSAPLRERPSVTFSGYVLGLRVRI